MSWESKRHKALQRQADRRVLIAGTMIVVAGALYFGVVKARFVQCESANSPDAKFVATISITGSNGLH